MTERRRHLYIGICGAPSTGKTALLCNLKQLMRKRKHVKLHEIRHCASIVAKRSAYPIDACGTMESQFAIDAEQLTHEERASKKHKITCRTIIDAYAYSVANKLGMNAYYESMLGKISKYTTLIYVPIEDYVAFIRYDHRTREYQKNIDKALRKIIKQHKIPVQVVSGNLDMRTNLAWQAVKLRM